MKNDLIQRYAYAVSSHFPANEQDDIAKEVENMITDLLEARYPAKQASEDDIKAVLTELGRPEELAVQFSGEENAVLVSGIYYLWFKRLAKLVIPIAIVATAFATLLENFTRPQLSLDAARHLATIIASVIGNAIAAGVQAFAVLVIIFAILERRKVTLDEVDFIASLPSVPVKQSQISVHHPILSIFRVLVVAIVMICFPYMVGAYSNSSGWIPVFNTVYVQSLWYLLLVAAASSVFRELFKLYKRHHCKALTIVVVVTNVVSLIASLIFLADKRIINPSFVAFINSLFVGEANEVIVMMFNHLNIFLMIVIIFALVLDSLVSLYNALRYRN